MEWVFLIIGFMMGVFTTAIVAFIASEIGNRCD